MERSEAKTKRKMIDLLSNYQWSYQYSIFCDVQSLDYEQAKDVAMSWIHDFDDKKLRDYLRKTSETAILFIVRAHTIRNRVNKKPVKQIYLTMYCNELLNLDNCERYFENDSYPINVMRKKISEWKIGTTCNALMRQALHNLDSLGEKKRYTVINRKLLITKVNDEIE